MTKDLIILDDRQDWFQECLMGLQVPAQLLEMSRFNSAQRAEYGIGDTDASP